MALPGPAKIRANVRGDEVGEYDIEILKVVSGSSDGRDMVLSVTDPELAILSRTQVPIQ